MTCAVASGFTSFVAHAGSPPINAYVLPLFQFYQPVVWKSALTFKPHLAGFILPQAVGRAGK